MYWSSSPRDRPTFLNSFKPWKFLIIPTIKTTFFKSILAIFTLAASISLYLVFTLSIQPICLIQNDAVTHRKISPEMVKTDISHVLFGIGGSTATWSDRCLYAELWWKPNVTRGFVWLDENPSTPESTSYPPYKISADTSRYKYSCWFGSRSAIRMARIVKESFELGLEGVRWFVMGDDDTVFFTENLVTVLGKYDHKSMYYVGGNSESVEQNVIHSYDMAFGGGGFAISYPLAAELVRVLDGCVDRYDYFYGSDQKVQGCLSEIGVPLTTELGFHQLDIRGNPYGLLAAHPVAPLVSLHHLDYVDPLFPNTNRVESIKKLMGAHETDPGRTIQHSFCYDMRRNWSISVSWGYTVQLYPSLVRAKALDTPLQTFQTWRSFMPEPFTFNTRPDGPDPCDRPIVYFLDRAESDGSSRTLTTYSKYVGDTENECHRVDYAYASLIRSFNVSASKFNSNLWNKAPRRQCCEVINGGQGVDDSVAHLQIRGCNPFESVTPHNYL